MSDHNQARAMDAADPWGATADRRDSVRVRLPFQVREVALGGSFEEHVGNLGLGGAYLEALHPPAGDRFELRFLLPGRNDEIRAVAEVLRVAPDGERFGIHLRFVELALEDELAVARFLQGGPQAARP